MKRMILTVVAMLSMTMTFAEKENTSSIMIPSAYKMEVNYGKLGEALRLTQEQLEDVKYVHGEFCSDMASIGSAQKDSRKMMMMNAIHKDLRYMRYILDRKQYHKYLMLLNTTLYNRGLTQE